MNVSPIKYPTAPKVKWAAVGSYLVGLAITAVYAILTDGQMVEGVPDFLVAMIAPLLPAGAAVAAGREAPHQYRTGEFEPRGEAEYEN